MDLHLTIAQSDKELNQILQIQAQNLPKSLSPEVVKERGFVTLQHNLEELKIMNIKANHIIAKLDDEVVGYALTLTKDSSHLVPDLDPMFALFNKLSINGSKLSDAKYYVMGQICVHDDYKRKGIFKRLYDKHKEVYAHQFDYCITEAATRNYPSMQAHLKQRFQIIHTYEDATDEWNILLWDWH